MTADVQFSRNLHAGRGLGFLRLNTLLVCCAAAVLFAMVFLDYREWSQYRLIENERLNAKTIEVTVATLLDGLLDSETGQRGFLLTGADRYLRPYDIGRALIPQQLTALNRLIPPGPILSRLNSLVNEKMTELADTIDLRRQKGMAPTVDVVMSDRGIRDMDEIRAICAGFRSEEETRRSEMAAEAAATGRASVLLTAVGSLFLISLLVGGNVAISRGTAARESALEEAESAREWLRTTLASIGDGVIATDVNGRIVFSNAVAQALLCWPEQELIGKELPAVFRIENQETRTPVENPVSKVLREGVICGLANHTILMARDGREIPIDDSSAPIRGRDGVIRGAVLVFRDIAERRKAEQEMASANMRLARANQDLERFAFIASHDLNEPLRMISSYAQLLILTYPREFEGEAGTFVGNIVEGTKRMRELLTDLLAYAEISANLEPPAEIVDLRRTVEQAIGNLKAAIGENGAAVSYDVLPAVRGHAAHFVSVFQNLIGNAIKYRSAQPPRIHISAEARGSELRLAVADNGIGIDPKYHDQIFEPFKRLHGGKISGTGIGLAICQRVVERYGGRIWVESQIGEGATFHVTLPTVATRAATGGNG